MFATDIMVPQTLEAAAKLQQENISAEVINIHAIKPIDVDTVVASVSKTGAAVTCENHNIIGGLQSAIAEVVTELCPVPIRAVGVKDQFGIVSKTPHLMEKYQLRAADIVERAHACLKVKAVECEAPAQSANVGS